MGVVTDVTVKGLTTAVTNISTSGMSDTTGQAINSTLGTLMTNTTGQSIASAISGLGTTLGSDRALIDGSNIGDKATFRQNLGLSVKNTTANIPSTAAGSYSTVTVNLTTPADVGMIVGYNIYGSTTLVPIQLYFGSSATSIQVRVLNHSASAQSGNIQLFYI